MEDIFHQPGILKKRNKFKDLRGFPFLSYLLGWGWPDTWIGVYLTGAATHREKLKQKQYPWKSLSTILCHHYVSRVFIIFQKEVSPIFKTVVDFQGAYKCIKWHPSSFFSLGKNRGLKESNDKMTSPPNHCYWQCLKLPWYNTLEIKNLNPTSWRFGRWISF